MNKKFTILFTALLISASAFSKSPFPVYKEDVEILKLEEQIKSLQDRVGILKSEKEKELKKIKMKKSSSCFKRRRSKRICSYWCTS